MNSSPKIILGTPILDVPTDTAVLVLDRMLDQGVPVRVAFANAHSLYLSLHNPKLRDALQKFAVFNDGIGVDIAAIMKYGSAFSSNLNGTDFIPHYLDKTARRYRIYLLGAKSGVIDEAAARLTQRYAGRHEIVGFRNGYNVPADLSDVIRTSAANLVLVGMGNPLQEIWIEDNLEKSGAAMAMGVGGLFDFVAGHLPRAPKIVRDLRCEWLYRLSCEPRRLLRRYTLESTQFIGCAVRDAVKHRLSL